jgi:hypothetical protein
MTDENTSQKAMLALAGAIIRKLLTVGGTALAAHGVLSSGSGVETFVSIGLAGAGIAWSFWNDYGRAIVLSQLEVLKAKSLAQAAKLQAHDLAPVTAEQIADHGPAELTAEKVVKVAATLCLLLAFGLIAGPAFAQTQSKRFVPTGNLKADIAAGIGNKVTDDGSAALNTAFSALAKPFQDIAKFIGDDADGAVSLATAVPEIQDGHGQQCWMAMASFGRIVKAHPVPLTLRVMTDLEALRLLGIAANRLCANVHCTQVFADQTAMIQAASPIPLILPSLHDLCTKVPQIAVIDALTVPPPAPVTPVTPQ